MKRFAVCLSLLLVVLAALPGGAALAGPGDGQASPYTLTGPYAYKNLTVFLVHGQGQKGHSEYLPLWKALEEKKAKVYETGSVGELSVENLSPDSWVMVHAGDIVRGGRQDRVLRFDMLLRPKSGKVPIQSFCVESGRWQRRGDESPAVFESAPKMAPGKEMKIASKARADQGRVWSSVAEQQEKLNEKLRRMKGDENLDVRSGESATSLALTLEDKDLKGSVQDYVAALLAAPKGQSDVLGFAFAIDGCLNSAEVYATPGLFASFWPRVLEAAATEALAKYDPDVKSRCTATAAGVQDMLTFPERNAAMPATNDLSRDTRINTWEAGRYLMYETLRREGKGAPGLWVHKSFLVQDEKAEPMPAVQQRMRE